MDSLPVVIVPPLPGRIVFFDGVCGLCNRFVDFLIRRDPLGNLLYAPLQGETARGLFTDPVLEIANTVIFCDAGKVYYRSMAAIRIVASLGGLWRLVHILRIFPRPFRDWAYNFVAKRRFVWFGSSETCRIPTPAEKHRFLK